MRIIRANRDYLHLLVAGCELARRPLQSRLADVDEDTSARVAQCIEKLLGLEAHTRPELHQRGVRAYRVCHFVDPPAHDPKLGPRRVVLGKLGDRFEEPCAQVIVEVLAGKRFRGTPKPLGGLGAEVADVGMKIWSSGSNQAPK